MSLKAKLTKLVIIKYISGLLCGVMFFSGLLIGVKGLTLAYIQRDIIVIQSMIDVKIEKEKIISIVKVMCNKGAIVSSEAQLYQDIYDSVIREDTNNSLPYILDDVNNRLYNFLKRVKYVTIALMVGLCSFSICTMLEAIREVKEKQRKKEDKIIEEDNNTDNT